MVKAKRLPSGHTTGNLISLAWQSYNGMTKTDVRHSVLRFARLYDTVRRCRHRKSVTRGAAPPRYCALVKVKCRPAGRHSVDKRPSSKSRGSPSPLVGRMDHLDRAPECCPPL